MWLIWWCTHQAIDFITVLIKNDCADSFFSLPWDTSILVITQDDSSAHSIKQHISQGISALDMQFCKRLDFLGNGKPKEQETQTLEVPVDSNTCAIWGLRPWEQISAGLERQILPNSTGLSKGNLFLPAQSPSTRSVFLSSRCEVQMLHLTPQQQVAHVCIINRKANTEVKR